MIEPAVYWDSCTFISLLQKTPGRIVALSHLLKEAEDGKLKIATSTATLAEVSREHKEGVIDDELSEKLLDFFENDYIVLRPLDRATGRYAHEIARKYSIKPLDAIHVATAIKSSIPTMHTYDSKKHRRGGLLKWSGKIGSPPLIIIVPPDPPLTLLSFTNPVADETASSDSSFETPASDAGT